MALQLLSSRFRCCCRFPVMDAGAEAGAEGVVFAARRAWEVRLLANRGLTRSQRRRLRVLFRALLAELDLVFPVVVRAD